MMELVTKKGIIALILGVCVAGYGHSHSFHYSDVALFFDAPIQNISVDIPIIEEDQEFSIDSAFPTIGHSGSLQGMRTNSPAILIQPGGGFSFFYSDEDDDDDGAYAPDDATGGDDLPGIMGDLGLGDMRNGRDDNKNKNNELLQDV